tara:strand:- start:5485 stop:8676 length:3192 start_codon:yes stop_codon:yes gene_type:complete
MITIRKSNSLYTLVSLLGDALKENSPDNPLQPQTIIVPNLDTARWLKLELAERMGIAANMECILPSEWLYRQIRNLYPDLPKKMPSDILPMTWSIYNILIDESQRSQYGRIDSYIKRQAEGNIENATWQLSGQIASVFDEYIVYRPELLLGWQEGHIGKLPDEEWQAHLWKLLNSRWKSLPNKNFHRNRAELYRDLLQSVDSKGLESEPTLFVFNPGLTPKPILNFLKSFGDYSDILFLRISPTKMSRDKDKPAKNPLLASFGRESEQLELVFEELFGDTGTFIDEDEISFTPNTTGLNGTETQLKRIQNSIIENKTISECAPVDGSVRIHSCHSPLREIETLHQTLIELFETDSTLHPDDILVTTPDPETYEPFIRAVFGTVEDGLPEIPWHLSLPIKRDNAPMRTFTLWLHLPDSRFQYQQVMELFSMKPVWEKTGLGESDVETIKSWMEENSVIWGLDKNHRSEVGQPATDYQTWESALKRGWFGQWMADGPGIMKEDTLLYAGIGSSSQMEAWAAFSSFMNGLDRFRKEIKEPRTAAEWCDQIRYRFEQLVGGELLGTPEGSSINKSLEMIHESVSLIAGNQKIPFTLIRSMITSQLENTGSSGAVFTRGVTFSSMVPVRSIPFRVVAMIGLNESTFPRKDTMIDFNLMAQQPKTGERNRKHEDRNLFLESVLTASDIHYLSYVGQSPVDNEELPPSTIVTEWIDQVSTMSGSKSDEVVQKEALHLFSESYFREKRIYSGLAHSVATNLKKQDTSVSGLILDLKNEPDDEWVEEFTFDRFVNFFKNPVRAYVMDQLGASFRYPEEERDEFSINHLERHLLFQKMMGWLITGMSEPEILHLIRKAGLVPDGWVGESLLIDLLNHCKTALEALKDKGEEPRFTELNIDLQIENARFSETILSYRDHSLLDIEPSKQSGALLFKSWIRHLIWQASSGDRMGSSLLCDLKKGDPKWFTFKPAEHPEKILRKLISLYQKGQSEPLLFFPKSLYEYKENEGKGKPEDECVQKAAQVFEGNDFSFGESSDLSIQMLLGPEVAFDPEWLKDEYLAVMNDMFEHLEVQ